MSSGCRKDFPTTIGRVRRLADLPAMLCKSMDARTAGDRPLSSRGRAARAQYLEAARGFEELSISPRIAHHEQAPNSSTDPRGGKRRLPPRRFDRLQIGGFAHQAASQCYPRYAAPQLLWAARRPIGGQARLRNRRRRAFDRCDRARRSMWVPPRQTKAVPTNPLACSQPNPKANQKIAFCRSLEITSL